MIADSSLRIVLIVFFGLTNCCSLKLLSLPLPFPPLLCAIADNNPPIVCLLLHNQANPNLQDAQGTPALVDALRKGKYAIAELLLQSDNICIAARDCKGITPLMAVMHSEMPIGLIKLLLEAGADTEDCNNRQQTPTIKAAICNRPDILQELVKHGADLHAEDKAGWSAVKWAAMLKCEDALRFLVRHGAGMTEVQLSQVELRHKADFKAYIEPFNRIAGKRSALIENELYKFMPRVLASLIREFETSIKPYSISNN